MNNILTYKDFIGSVHFSAEDNIFFGKVEGVNDLITFEGESVTDLTNAFHSVVDEHIKDCERENIPAEKSYNGSFNVRLTPELHRKVALTARAQGQSLNQFIYTTLDNAVIM
jgi:predicted HicB family RNase H-like nuclease